MPLSEALIRLALFAFFGAASVLYTDAVVQPALSGVPCTWDNAPRLVVAIPTFVLFAAMWVVAYTE